MLPRFVPLMLVFCWCQSPLTPLAHADIQGPDKKKGPAGAPAIFPMTVTAVRGQPLVIELKGVSSAGEISFKIASKAKLGKVEGLRRVDRDRSAVTYTAPLDTTGSTDEFTYNAQATGTPVSEPEKVTVRITDAAPKLEVQDVADAGRVVMGHPKEVLVRIRNAGNAAWSTTVPAPKGWRWLKPEGGAFDLAPGATGDFSIQCESLSPASLDESIVLAGERKLRFKANIVAPFAASGLVTLKWNGQSRTRTGNIEIQNLDREAPVTVKVAGPELLTLPESLAVEADKKGGIAVTLAEHFAEPFNGKIKLTGRGWTQEVQVKASPSPALLKVTSGASPDNEVPFGKLDAESIKSAKRTVTVLNEGGTVAQVTTGELKAFRIETPPPAGGISIPPGGEADIVLLPPNDTIGTHREVLALTDGDSRIELQLTAGVPDSAIAATPGNIAGQQLNKDARRLTMPRPPRTQSQKIREAVQNMEGAFASDGKEDPKVPRVNAVEPEIGPDSATFTWDLPPGDGWKFLLYYAAIEKRSDGRPVKMRYPCGDEVTYKINGRKASATATGLQPNRWYKYSIQTIAPDGRASVLGREFGIQLSTPMKSHFEEYWLWYLAGGVGGAAGGYWLRKKWNEPISAVS